MLPYIVREIIAGNVPEAVVSLAEWSKLQSFIRGLDGGNDALAFAGQHYVGAGLKPARQLRRGNDGCLAFGQNPT